MGNAEIRDIGWYPVDNTPAGRTPFTIRAEAEQLVGTVYSSVWHLQDWSFLQLLLNITASQTDAGDSLIVSVEFSDDEALWRTVATFETQGGNGSAATAIITFETDLAVDPDAVFEIQGDNAGVVDEKSIGKYMRIKSVVAETNDAAHTWGMLGYIGEKVEIPE